MKIALQIRDVYQNNVERFKRLHEEVKLIIKPEAEQNNWFFMSRLKSLESFALKVETGRVRDPDKLEDFVGVTVVVPTLRSFDEVVSILLKHFDESYRRPTDETKTHKAPSSFVFDDLRIYLARRPQSSGRDADNDGAIFEVQVKTVLQYAWTVATHDLVYKTDAVSWPLERIAFQVKAMLEHAEVAISEASMLSNAPSVAKQDSRTIAIVTIINSLTKIWTRDRLPSDVKRLAETISQLLECGNIAPNDLETVVDEERSRVGILPSNLSPYSFVAQALANRPGFEQTFKRSSVRVTLVLHREMDLPGWTKQAHRRLLWVGPMA